MTTLFSAKSSTPFIVIKSVTTVGEIDMLLFDVEDIAVDALRSEERRVGKEC